MVGISRVLRKMSYHNLFDRLKIIAISTKCPITIRHP